MKYEDKKEKLKQVHESAIRQLVIIPLLKAMGYSEVHEFHGPIEKGKDILFREPTKLGESFIHAVIASTEDMNGKVGDSKSASRILEQAEMVFNEPYKDKYTGKTMTVDRCWVITTGNITPQAIESIAGKLEKYNLNRLIRFIDGDRLIELLDQHYPQFWQRSDQDVFYSKHEWINIATNKLDEPFDKELDDLGAAGNLKDTVYRIKKLVESLLSDLDYDIRDRLAELLKSNHPWDIFSIWEDLISDRMDINGHISLGFKVQDINQECEYLHQDLLEYEKRFSIDKDKRHVNRGGG